METSAGRTIKVLVVEDEPTIGEFCRRVLANDGYTVDIAVDGNTAQCMIVAQQYDCFLFDLKLPKISGSELYQWLQSQFPQLTGRVIFTTGSVLGANVRTFLEQTGRPILLKPYTSSELKTKVRESLEQAAG
jgi:DNA-binding response OmpR family regulator